MAEDKLKKLREGAAKKNWIQKAAKSMKKRDTVGEFTRKAKAAGYTKKEGDKTVGDAQAYAKHVLANKDKFDKETIKQAQFAASMGKIAKDDKD